MSRQRGKRPGWPGVPPSGPGLFYGDIDTPPPVAAHTVETDVAASQHTLEPKPLAVVSFVQNGRLVHAAVDGLPLVDPSGLPMYFLSWVEHMDEERARLSLDNQVEASLLDLMLVQDGVPHMVRSYQDRAYGRLWQFQQGWGYVETPARYASGVRVLLDLIRSNKFTPEEQDPA